MAAANTHAEWQRNASEMEALVHARQPHWERTLFDYELVSHRLEVRLGGRRCSMTEGSIVGREEVELCELSSTAPDTNRGFGLRQTTGFRKRG